MPKVSKNYSRENIEIALTEIHNGLSIHAASRKYSIPRSTIQNRIHNRAKKCSFGPSPVLTTEEETHIVEWLIANHAKGFPRRKQDVQNTVKIFLDVTPRDNPFKNNLPGNHWYESFLKRHPNMTVRTPEPITDASSKVAETNIRGWFNQIKTYLSDKGFLNILEDQSRIFNGDETNFLMCPKTGKVIAPKGSKNVYEIDRGQAKENLTVMFSFSASGFVAPPLLVYPYKRVPADVISSIPDGLKWLKSDSGWMTTEVFYQYIEDIFYPSVVAQNVEFPIILYVDGHKTHLTYQLSKLCEKLKIILICLYPNSTRILQPADVSIFKPLKTGWQRAVLNWRKENIDQKLTKACFAPILKTVIDKYINKSSIINGFRTCGLFPFNPDAIDYSKCLGRNSSNVDQFSTGDNQGVSRNQVESSINFENFKNIVGSDKLLQLENLPESPSEDLLILQQIYRTFLSNADTTNQMDNTFIFDNDVAIGNDVVIDNDGETEEDNLEQAIITEPKDVFGTLSQEIQTIEFIDEFNGPENLNSSGLPVLYLDDPNVQIQSFLTVPQTPVRKGIKNSEHRSFIISSTPYQKEEENKINKKKIAETEKENRIRERQIKKEKKDQEAMLKLKRKLERIDSRLLKKPKPSRSASEKLREVFQNITKNDRPSEVPRTNNMANESHVRKLNLDEYDTNVTCGMCFKCAGHITSSKFGVACNSCKFRRYHIECAGTNINTKFICSACIPATQSFKTADSHNLI